MMENLWADYLDYGFNTPEGAFVWATFRFGMRLGEAPGDVALSFYYPHDEGVLLAHGDGDEGARRFQLARGDNCIALRCREAAQTFAFRVTPKRALPEDVRELAVMLRNVETAAEGANFGEADDWVPVARTAAATSLGRHLLESFIAPGILVPYIMMWEGRLQLEVALYLPPGERDGPAMMAPFSVNGRIHEIAVRQEDVDRALDQLSDLAAIRYRGFLDLTEYLDADGKLADLDIFYADRDGREILSFQSAHWRGEGYGAVPSDENIFRVAGKAAEEFFLFSGATWCIKMIRLYESLAGQKITACGPILDWGVGCGRIARFFPAEIRGRVTGVDIDQFNVDWCRENMPEIKTTVTAPAPPLPFDDATFELVFGHSVMTHLSEADQYAWLAELARVTKPGGICLLTVLAEVSWFIRFFPAGRTPDNIAQFMDIGFVDDGSLDVGVDQAQPGVYRNVSHTTAYIRREWSKYFAIQTIIPAFAGLQNLVVMRRK
jgi:SAM-dependent methyltransferase